MSLLEFDHFAGDFCSIGSSCFCVNRGHQQLVGGSPVVIRLDALGDPYDWMDILGSSSFPKINDILVGGIPTM